MFRIEMSKHHLVYILNPPPIKETNKAECNKLLSLLMNMWGEAMPFYIVFYMFENIINKNNKYLAC